MDNHVNRHKKILVCLCLTLLTFIVFWHVQYHYFIHYDDMLYVTENRHVQGGLSWGNVVWAFTTYHASNWHPLTWLSLMLDYELFRLNPAGYHWTNVLFHIANTLLLFLVLNRMTGAIWRSGFVAALFALHPLHVESVAWVAERKDVLSTLFWMLTIYAYVFYVERPGIKRYLTVFVCFSLGLMAKPMLVTLPFVLLLLDYWPLGRTPFTTVEGHIYSQKGEACHHRVSSGKSTVAHLVVEKIPLIVLSIFSSILTLFAQKNWQAVVSLDAVRLDYRVANAFISSAKYIEKTFWPKDLALFYPYIMGIFSPWRIMCSFLLFVGISVVVIREIRRYPHLMVGWLWYLGTLIPVIGLVQVGSQAMADRYTYVPLIGLFIMVSWGVQDLLSNWRYRMQFFLLSSGLIFSILMVLSWMQVQHWQSSITLFEHALRVTKGNYLVHNNLGVALFQDGKSDEAMVHFAKACQIKPDYYDAYNNMGLVLGSQGKVDEAIAHYYKALKIKPDHPETYNNLGVALVSLGRYNDAIVQYTEALRINPGCAMAHNNLGIAFANLGRLHEAIECFKKALEINPDYDDALNNMGSALARRGDVRNAVYYFEKALQLDANNAMVHNNLGMALARTGRYDDAVLHFREALKIRPDYLEAYNNLQTTLRHIKDAERSTR